MIIIGAGLSGLLAASVFPTARVIEALPESAYQAHAALLRFRTPSVGEAIGIPFRPVTVYKAIWSGMGFTNTPSPCVANAYSIKVTGRILPRSIWDLRPVERFLAPPDMIPRLLDAVRPRITWGTPVTRDFFASDPERGPVISTMPMPLLAKLLIPQALGAVWAQSFSHQGITVLQFRIPDCDAYQTIYYPDSSTSVYRASLTGDILIIEAMGEAVSISDSDLNEVFVSFGIDTSRPELLVSTSRKFGKIAPAPEALRKQLIVKFTNTWGIYSAGRYALWKNILMDDLLHDLHVIRRLINSGEYGRILHLNQ